MPFSLQEVDFATDFAEIIDCEFTSYQNPEQTFFYLFCPVHGTRSDAVKDAVIRQLGWHTSDPTSYWQKVVNDEGKIVAAALWKICPTNPFEHEEHFEIDWYPEGGQLDYVTQALERFEAPRMRMGQRPQVCMWLPCALQRSPANLNARSEYHLHAPRLSPPRGRGSHHGMGYCQGRCHGGGDVVGCDGIRGTFVQEAWFYHRP